MKNVSAVQVHNSCFYKGAKQLGATCLISNPPYIPAPDNKLMMPELFGGVDGCNLTKVTAMQFHTLCHQSPRPVP